MRSPMTDASDYEVYMQYVHWSMGGEGGTLR